MANNKEEQKKYSDIDLSKYDGGFQASNDLNQKEQNKNDVTDKWQNYGSHEWDKAGLADDVLNEYLNREKFSYDLNGDALYQQYKDKYIKQGKLAMQDTMGQAAAMTGGYGNSYAASVGNQAYQASLENLNDVIPELYQLAYDKYNQEGQDMLSKYGLLMNDYDMSYNEWKTGYDMLTDQMSHADSDYWNSYNAEYGEWSNDRAFDQSQYWNETEFGYGQERDRIADEQWQQSFDWQKSQAEKSASGGGGDDNDDVIVDDDKKPDDADELPSGVRKKLENATSNTEVESILESAEASGLISHEAALKAMSEFMDYNEKYIEHEDGTRTISFKDMVNSTKGWEVVDDGGANWFWGVDNNARVKAPNGETYRLDALVDILVSEGVNKSDAKSFVKKLQKNLGI